MIIVWFNATPKDTCVYTITTIMFPDCDTLELTYVHVHAEGSAFDGGC